MNKNYLKIYNSKKKSSSLLKNILNEAFKNRKLSKKQKLWGIVSLFCLGVATIMRAQVGQVGGLLGLSVSSYKIRNVSEVLTNAFGTESHVEVVKEMASDWSSLNIVKTFLEYISDIQLASIKVVNDLPFGSIDMFEHIVTGITIFAIIGCLYKVFIHFVNTERFDNVKAFTGFFQYFGIALLFIFSDQIVDRVVSLNQPINAEKMKAMSSSLSAELDRALVTDLKKVVEEMSKIEVSKEELQKQKANSWLGVSESVKILGKELEIWKLKVYDANFALMFKYAYYTIFIMLISSIMAIPGFILSVMVKVLLTVMIAGTKLVFLLAFIPGFENTWKTFMLNMLNILLWAPIFNAVYSFIVALIIGLMTDNTLGSGQIVWLSIVAIILAFQSLSLTTSAAGVVINGAGASMAGAMGAITAMSGASMGMSVAKTAVGVGTSVAGSAVGTSIGASKFMKK